MQNFRGKKRKKNAEKLCGKLTGLCGNFNKVDGKVRTTVEPKAVLAHNLKEGFIQKLAPSYRERKVCTMISHSRKFQLPK